MKRTSSVETSITLPKLIVSYCSNHMHAIAPAYRVASHGNDFLATVSFSVVI